MSYKAENSFIFENIMVKQADDLFNNESPNTVKPVSSQKKINFFKKKSKVKEVFLHWSQTADINGYNKIFEYNKNYAIQFIWIIILLGSTGATFYFIANSIISYLNYETVSKTDIVYVIPTDFPTVTICGNDAFTSKDAEHLYDKTLNVTGYPLGSVNLVDDNFNRLVQVEASSPAYGDDKRKRLGFDLSLITSCKYNTIKCGTDLHWYWSYDYGNCWQFNSGFNLTNQVIDIKNSTLEGRDYGLSMVIYPIINNNRYMTTWDNGMIVFIHNSSFRPLITDAVYIEAGKTSFISVQRKFTQKQPEPYSDCVDLGAYSSYLYNYIKSLNQTYRQQDCFKLCIQEQIIAKCQCYDLEYPNLNTALKPCLNLADFSCLDDRKKNFNVGECRQNSCPLECETVNYELSLSQLVNPGLKEYVTLSSSTILSLSQKLGTNLTYELFKSMWVSVKVFYPTLQYTQIS